MKYRDMFKLIEISRLSGITTCRDCKNSAIDCECEVPEEYLNKQLKDYYEYKSFEKAD